MKTYEFDLAFSEDKNQRQLSKQLKNNFNYEYADKLLDLYMERCKEKHRLAFYQFLRIIKAIDTDELDTSFINGKRRMQKVSFVIANEML